MGTLDITSRNAPATATPLPAAGQSERMELIRQDRVQRVLQLMRAERLDGILVSNCSLGNLNTWMLAKTDMPLHLPYNRSNLLLILPDGSVTQYCSREPHPTDWGKFPLITEAALPAMSRLGLVNGRYLKRCVRDFLLAGSPELELVEISRAFHLLCAEKIPEEVQCAELAAKKLDTAFLTLPLLLTGEPLERQVAARLRNRLRELGAECEDLGSSTILNMTSAPDGSAAVPEPIAWPGRRIAYGDRVNVQVNAFLPGGFASALGRTYILGEPSAESRQYWNLAVQAQQLAASLAVPGATIAQILKQVRREILDPAGLPDAGGNQIYGIGAGLSETPRNIDTSRDLPLQEHMTMVIAIPVCPPGKDPYCCMDTFAVAPDGARRLSTLPQELIVLD